MVAGAATEQTAATFARSAHAASTDPNALLAENSFALRLVVEQAKVKPARTPPAAPTDQEAVLVAGFVEVLAAVTAGVALFDCLQEAVDRFFCYDQADDKCCRLIPCDWLVSSPCGMFESLRRFYDACESQFPQKCNERKTMFD
jgi:hypothetical protein